MEHLQKQSKILEQIWCKKTVVLTAVRSDLVHGGASVTLRDYDDNQVCIQDNTDTGNALQRGFADSSSVTTQSRRFSVALVHIEILL